MPGQRFGNPTIGKQRKSKQFKSARVVKTLPRTGVLLPTFLTSAHVGPVANSPPEVLSVLAGTVCPG
jgi:hypothetical protein